MRGSNCGGNQLYEALPLGLADFRGEEFFELVNHQNKIGLAGSEREGKAMQPSAISLEKGGADSLFLHLISTSSQYFCESL